MSNCHRCGVPFHPELPSCPVCGTTREREAKRRGKFWFLVNTVAVSFVALVVLTRTLTGGAAVGMSAEDCSAAKNLAAETRNVVFALEGNEEAGRSQLVRISGTWAELAANYTPGKYSWSTSGLEHNWLDRLSLATAQLANGDEVSAEGATDPKRYVVELTRLLPRYCS